MTQSTPAGMVELIERLQRVILPIPKGGCHDR